MNSISSTLLTEACQKGDLAEVQQAIQSGAKPDHDTLTFACATRNIQIVDLVLAQNARPDGDTLSIACATNEIAIVQKVIEKGAGQNHFTKKIAMRIGNQEILNLISNTPSSLYDMDVVKFARLKNILPAEFNRYTLFYALKTKDDKTIESVIASGAAPHEDALEENELNFACKNLSPEIVKMVLKVKGIKPVSDTLLLAIKTRKMEIVDSVLNLGAKPDSGALNEAIQEYLFIGLQGINKMIDLGALPDSQTLSHAFKTCDMQIVDKILSLGTKPDSDTLNVVIKNYKSLGMKGIEKVITLGALPGHNTLNLAIETCQMEIVEKILSMKVAPNWYHLRYAIQKGQKAMVARFLSMNVKPEDDMFDTALATGKKEIVEMVLSLSVKPDMGVYKNYLNKAILSKNSKIVQVVSSLDVELNMDHYKDILDAAIDSRQYDIIGVVLRMKGKSEGILNHLIRKKSNRDVLEIALAAGMKPNEETLDIAFENGYGDRSDVKLLLENGAKPSAQTVSIFYKKYSSHYVLVDLYKAGAKLDEECLKKWGMISDFDTLSAFVSSGLRPTEEELRSANKYSYAYKWWVERLYENKVNAALYFIQYAAKWDQDIAFSKLKQCINEGEKANSKTLDLAIETISDTKTVSPSEIIKEVIAAGAKPSANTLTLACKCNLKEQDYNEMLKEIMTASPQADGETYKSIFWTRIKDKDLVNSLRTAFDTLESKQTSPKGSPNEKDLANNQLVSNAQLKELNANIESAEKQTKLAAEEGVKVKLLVQAGRQNELELEDQLRKMKESAKQIAGQDPLPQLKLESTKFPANLQLEEYKTATSTPTKSTEKPTTVTTSSTASKESAEKPTVATSTPTKSAEKPTTVTTSFTTPIISAEKSTAVTSLFTASKKVKADQDVGLQLLKKVEEDAKHLATQTLADCQALLAQLKQEMKLEMEKNQQKQLELSNEITRLKTELLKAQGQLKAELEKRIADLEQNQSFLIQDYETQQAILAQREKILGQQDLAKFYRTMQNKLQQIFLGYKVIGSGMVVNNALSTADKAVQAIALAGESIPLPGSQAVATWLGYAIQAGVWLANKKAGDNDNMRVGNITELVVSFQELDYLTETTSRQLTLMFQEQLHDISIDMAGLLAESAVKLMVAYLWSNEYQSLPLNEQLIASVAKVHPVEGTGFFQKLSQKFEKLKGKFTDENLTTKNGEHWTAFGVFQRPGLEIENEFYSGQGTQPELYGYRLGKAEEVKKANLVRDPKRIERSKKLAPSTEKHLRILAELDKEKQNQIELLKKRNQLKPITTSREIGEGIIINELTLYVDRNDLQAKYVEQVNQLLEQARANCPEENVKRNFKNEIISISFTAAIYIERFEKKLVKILNL